MRKLPLGASTILSLLTVVSSFAVGPQQQRPALQQQQQSTATARPPSVAASIRRKRTKRRPNKPNNKNNTNNNNNNNNRTSRTTQRRTPVVDSDLLRFVSAQKRARLQQQQQQQKLSSSSSLLVEKPSATVEEIPEPLPSLGTEPSRSTGGGVDFSGFAAYVTSLFSSPTTTRDDNNNNNNNESKTLSTTKQDETTTTTTTTDTGIMDDTTVDDPYAGWLRQYNRNRVATLLTSRLRNDDNDKVLSSSSPVLLQASIALAGERVQSQALARTARQRVREFLKERDQVWAKQQQQEEENTNKNATTAMVDKTDNDSASTTTTTTTTTPPVIMPSYQRNNTNNLEQVVDLLLENGLLVRDVTEILIHSPGIALMQPRVVPSPQQQQEEDADDDDDDVVRTTTTTTTTTNGEGGGETVEETLHRVLVELLGNTLQLRKTDARKVLRDTPGLLTKRGSKSATEMVSLLKQLRVSTKSIARNKRELPALLSRAPAAVFRLVAFLSSDAVRMPVHQIGPLFLSTTKRSSCQELLNAVAPVQRLEEAMRTRRQINGMKNVSTINDDADAAAATATTTIVTTTRTDDVDDEDDLLLYDTAADETDPGVLSALYGRGSQLRRQRINELYRNMSETAWTLRHEIGTVDLGKVIAAYPSVLLLDAKEQILPAADFSMTKLGVWEDDLPRVLQLYPALLGKPVEEMKQVEDFLLSLEIPSEQLPMIFRSFPALLSKDVDSEMRPVVDFLRKEVGVSNVGRFVSRLPAVLGYSIAEDLKPKWDYLSSFMVDARFEVSRFPAFFSYPLERVIRPRFSYLQEVKGIPAALLMTRLDNVVRYGDQDFAVKVAKDRDGGEAFARFVVETSQKRKKKRMSNRQQPPRRQRGKQQPRKQHS